MEMLLVRLAAPQQLAQVVERAPVERNNSAVSEALRNRQSHGYPSLSDQTIDTSSTRG
jgi:hypothetical protein